MANKKKTTVKSVKKNTKSTKKVEAKKIEKEVEDLEELEEEDFEEEYENEESEDESEDEEYEEDAEEEYEEDAEEEYEEEVKEKPVKKKDYSTKENSNKTLIIILIIVAIFIGISFILPGTENSDENKTVTEAGTDINAWLEDSKSDKVVTIIGMSTCGHCQAYKPVITDLANKNGFKLYFFEIDGLSDEESKVLTETYKIDGYEGYVPYTFIVEKGKVLGDTTGYADEETTIEFLNKYNLLK